MGAPEGVAVVEGVAEVEGIVEDVSEGVDEGAVEDGQLISRGRR